MLKYLNFCRRCEAMHESGDSSKGTAGRYTGGRAKVIVQEAEELYDVFVRNKGENYVGCSATTEKVISKALKTAKAAVARVPKGLASLSSPASATAAAAVTPPIQRLLEAFDASLMEVLQVMETRTHGKFVANDSYRTYALMKEEEAAQAAAAREVELEEYMGVNPDTDEEEYETDEEDEVENNFIHIQESSSNNGSNYGGVEESKSNDSASYSSSASPDAGSGNRDGQFAPENTPSKATAATAAAPTAAGTIAPGTRVRLCNLKNKPEMNEREGIVVHSAADSVR